MKITEILEFLGQMARQAITGNKGKMLEPGTAAPDFMLQDETGKIHTLSQYRGTKIILWFFPRADTPGCTLEGKGFRDRIQEFEKKNITVLAVSTDRPEDNLAFKQKFGFSFPLLCDTSGKISHKFGAAADEEAAFANRITYLIDEHGNIEEAFAKVTPANHAEELLKLVP